MAKKGDGNIPPSNTPYVEDLLLFVCVRVLLLLVLQYQGQTEPESFYLQTPRDFRSLGRRRRRRRRRERKLASRAPVPCRSAYRLHGAGAGQWVTQFTTTTQVVTSRGPAACTLSRRVLPAHCPRGAAPGLSEASSDFFIISSLHGFHAHWNRTTISNMLLLVKEKKCVFVSIAVIYLVSFPLRSTMPIWHNLTFVEEDILRTSNTRDR